MEIISSSPIVATGFDTYAFMRRLGITEGRTIIYLKVAVEGGFVGLLLFLWLLFQLVREVSTCSEARDDPLLSSFLSV